MERLDQKEASLGVCAEEVYAEYQGLQEEIARGERDVESVIEEKHAILRADGQEDISMFVRGMQHDNPYGDRKIAHRMCFGAFFMYEALQRYSRVKQGRDLPVVRVHEANYRGPKDAHYVYGNLIKDRPEIATEVMELFNIASSRQGGVAMLVNFAHLFSRTTSQK